MKKWLVVLLIFCSSAAYSFGFRNFYILKDPGLIMDIVYGDEYYIC